MEVTENTSNEVVNQQRNNILIVDDEALFLKILRRMLEKHFNVKTASSGKEGLEILNQGFKPGVILSDQRMPGMTGSEFLEESIKIVPEASRIILTGYSTPKDIIPCINQAHAYMYLTKPVEDMQLVQAVRIGFDHFKAQLKTVQVNAQLNLTEKKLKNAENALSELLTENKTVAKQTIESIANSISVNDIFYFNNYIKFVTPIINVVTEELHLNPETNESLIQSTRLYKIISSNLPPKFILRDPYELLEERDIFEYIKSYISIIDNFKKIKSIQRQLQIVSQIWERIDGTGYPKKLFGQEIFKESQILSLINIYRNNVYRLKLEDVARLKRIGEVQQTPEETVKRHTESFKMLYKKANWFDYDVFNVFQELIKKHKIESLAFHEKPLVIRLMNTELNPAKPPQQTNGKENVLQPSDVIELDLIKGEQMVEIEIPIEKLDIGMVIAQNVVTKSGFLIVRQDTQLTNEIVKNLKQHARIGMISGYVSIFIPNNKQ